METTPPPS